MIAADRISTINFAKAEVKAEVHLFGVCGVYGACVHTYSSYRSVFWCIACRFIYIYIHM